MNMNNNNNNNSFNGGFPSLSNQQLNQQNQQFQQQQDLSAQFKNLGLENFNQRQSPTSTSMSFRAALAKGNNNNISQTIQNCAPEIPENNGFPENNQINENNSNVNVEVPNDQPAAMNVSTTILPISSGTTSSAASQHEASGEKASGDSQISDTASSFSKEEEYPAELHDIALLQCV